MTMHLFPLIDEFAGRTVLVIGEAMLDTYLSGSSNRLCPEAPVPAVAITESKHVPGGAANSAVNVTALGGNALFLSVVGDDREGEELREALHARNVGTEHIVVQRGRRTLTKNRVIAGDHMLVRFDQGSTENMDSPTERVFIEGLRELFPHCDAVMVSDYAYGVLTPRVIQELAILQTRMPRIFVVDSKNLLQYADVGVTAIKPNYKEAVKLLDIHPVDETRRRAEQMIQHGKRILEMTRTKIAAVTLDSDGALIFEQEQDPYRTYAQPAPNSRAAGAGDTFISTLTLALAAGASTQAAAELASAAAALVVQKEGTATCNAQELRGYVASVDKYATDLSALQARVEYYREQGKRIVLTNGCFDILHSGHIGYLNRAKELGDILIVGVNADATVRRLKGAERPINSLEDRVQVLAALSCVDHIVAFEQETPIELVRALHPDVFVKGGDYTRETLPEAQEVEAHGGRIEILPYLPEHSTTQIIARIRETKGNGNGNGNGLGHSLPVPYRPLKIGRTRTRGFLK